jgi:hypothetical protein
MLSAKITIRYGAIHDSLTVNEPSGTTHLDMSKMTRTERNAVRRLVVGVFKKEQTLAA